MKKFCYLFFILLFVSCSGDDTVKPEPIVELDNLKIGYKGYYQVFFDEPYVNEVYNDITVTPITEQTSPTETIDLLKVNAYSDGATQDYISFYIVKNTIGNNVLYNNRFTFRSFGATYLPSNLHFEVLVNNDTEFNANFSGELEHWYEGEMRYVYLDISSASISIFR
jgi:hypothetical protein